MKEEVSVDDIDMQIDSGCSPTMTILVEDLTQEDSYHNLENIPSSLSLGDLRVKVSEILKVKPYE